MSAQQQGKRRAWDVADRELASAQKDLAKYRTSNPKLARSVQERIDKWLDYRAAHGPEDLVD